MKLNNEYIEKLKNVDLEWELNLEMIQTLQVC